MLDVVRNNFDIRFPRIGDKVRREIHLQVAQSGVSAKSIIVAIVAEGRSGGGSRIYRRRGRDTYHHDCVGLALLRTDHG